MQIHAVAILALCAAQFYPSFAARDFNVYRYSKDNPIDRLLTLMRNLYDTGDNRVRQLLYHRSQYENSLEFEMGYVMGEIIERYRQLVLHLKNSLKFKNYKVHDKLIRLEFMQKLYFEIYHLVMMMHELPRKYGYRAEELTVGIQGAKNDNSTLTEAMADLPIREQEREREKRQRIRDLQAQQVNYAKYLSDSGKPTAASASKTRSRFWPIDYGWSIENW